jgi:hypothetical protein
MFELVSSITMVQYVMFIGEIYYIKITNFTLSYGTHLCNMCHNLMSKHNYNFIIYATMKSPQSLSSFTHVQHVVVYNNIFIIQRFTNLLISSHTHKHDELGTLKRSELSNLKPLGAINQELVLTSVATFFTC